MEILDPVQVSLHVELKDFGVAAGGGDFFEAGLGHGADEVDGAESLSGFGDGDSTLGSYQLQRADRREHHGNLS